MVVRRQSRFIGRRRFGGFKRGINQSAVAASLCRRTPKMKFEILKCAF
jgi:hypothetical protein